ncbi:MAG: TRAM domain-containing protein [Candidatus Tantalella remota]|nr:TRAM domain-containing protein [Candidatus Tantalella remota]
MTQQLTTEIYSLAFGGQGVGKVDGKVCFVTGALPGEKVVFDVEKDTARYASGKVVEILTPSSDRTEPECPYYGRCGGCQLQHITYEKELFYKKQQVAELLGRIGGIKDIEIPEIVASKEPYNYRTSVTLHDAGGGCGYYAIDGKTVMKIDRCSVATEAINSYLEGMTNEKKAERVTLKSDHAGKVWSSESTGERFFFDEFRGNEICLSTKGFSQPNRHIAEKIVETIEEWIGPDCGDTVFFDLYCGVGFFSFLLKNDFHSRIGIDSSRISIDCAKTTSAKNGRKDVKFYKSDAEEAFFSLFERSKRERNMILIDPPRKGLNGDFIKKLKEMTGAEKMYYLSCDPARLARDIKVITDENAWKLGRIRVFDMFPRTKHIETLVELVNSKL